MFWLFEVPVQFTILTTTTMKHEVLQSGVTVDIEGTATLVHNTSIVIRLNGSRIWLINCGDGTQSFFLNNRINFGRVDVIIITELTGSHIFGLPAFLAMLLYKKKDLTEQVTLLGPIGIQKYVDSVLKITDTFISKLNLKIIEIESDHNAQQEVHCHAFDKRHSMHLWAHTFERQKRQRVLFVIRQSGKPGIDREKASQLGVTEGAHFKALTNGSAVALNTGVVVTPEDVSRPPTFDKNIIIAPRCALDQLHGTVKEYNMTVDALLIESDTLETEKIVPKEYANVKTIIVPYIPYDQEFGTHTTKITTI
jgi:ribonuclease Z